MGVISFDSRARRWKADGSRAMSGSDIFASTSPKRDSMSRSFWNVMASIVNSGGVFIASRPPAPSATPSLKQRPRSPREREAGVDGASLRLGGSGGGGSRCGCRGRLLLLAPLPRVLLDLARRVDEALLAREERVAVRADLEP